MANIMITQRCNLNCVYCFANEFVNKFNTDISIQDFKQALDFILTDENEVVGLIGGEPTMHRDFEEILKTVIADERITKCVIFTNGIKIKEFEKFFVHPKFHFLINCNSPEMMGEKMYSRMLESIERLTCYYPLIEKVTLGFNMYEPNFEYDYILDVLNRFNLKTLRTSISVPNSEKLKEVNAIEYFTAMKPSVLNFYSVLLDNGVLPFYDCNAMPECILNEIERGTLMAKLQENNLSDNNLFSEITTCTPVIDITPDLKAIRCFALSEYDKVDIRDFNDIYEVKAYFSNQFDSFAFHVYPTSHCAKCQKRKVQKCSAGCFSFKVDQMIKCREYCEQLN